jgi:hypothetical protein
MTAAETRLVSTGHGSVVEPASLPPTSLDLENIGALVLADGTIYQGISFGAEQSVSGECVFQTGKI